MHAECMNTINKPKDIFDTFAAQSNEMHFCQYLVYYESYYHPQLR